MSHGALVSRALSVVCHVIRQLDVQRRLMISAATVAAADGPVHGDSPRWPAGWRTRSRIRSRRFGSTWSCWPRIWPSRRRRAIAGRSRRLQVVQPRVPAAAESCSTIFCNFAKARRLQLGAFGPEREQIAGVGFLPAQGGRSAGRDRSLSRSGLADACMLDREAFQAALLNLIINAKQAMPDGGQLVVRTAAERHGRGAGPDRHRLRHGRADGVADVRGVFTPPSRAARAWVCRRRKRSSTPTAAGSACRAKSAAARKSRSSCRCRRGWAAADVAQ